MARYYLVVHILPVLFALLFTSSSTAFRNRPEGDFSSSYLHYDSSHPNRVGGYGIVSYRDQDCSGDYSWSEWIDSDTPNDGVDKEHICLIHELYPNSVCHNPIAVQARTINGVPAEFTGQYVTLNLQGLICYNEDQWGRFDYRTNVACFDYAVRFCCPQKSGSTRATFETKPEDTRADIGDDVTFHCSITGHPKLTVSWYRYGTLITKSTKYCLGDNGDLTIRDVGLSDEALYVCAADTLKGYLSSGAHLKVKVPDGHVFRGDALVKEAVEEAAIIVKGSIADTKDYYKKLKSLRPTDLIRKNRQPRGNSTIHQGCAVEICLTAVSLVSKKIKDTFGEPPNDMGCGTGTLLRINGLISPEKQRFLQRTCGCDDRDEPDCSSCEKQSYRTIDGSCNNLENPTWGASETPFIRFLEAGYEDGLCEPIGWNPGLLYNGYPKPSARDVSHAVLASHNPESSQHHTQFIMQWGQFMDHDFSLASENPSRESFDQAHVDCSMTCENVMPCFPIPTSPKDPRTKGHCLDVTRSSASCGTGNFLHPREQINVISSYIDASMVYGSTDEMAEVLRDLDSRCGLLKMNTKEFDSGGLPYLPYEEHPELACLDAEGNEEGSTCYAAGDIRVNEQLMLTAIHTVFAREHNRVANELCGLNPQWDSERIYQEARKIVYAIVERITFEEWLPKILGPRGLALLGSYGGYDPSVDASISNVFATAVFRMGHGLIQPEMGRLGQDFKTLKPWGNMPLHHAFFTPYRIYAEGGTGPLLRALYSLPAKVIKAGEVMNSELTEHLFDLGRNIAHDLGALNIHRGRDHGLPAYNDWRVFCGLPRARYWSDFSKEIRNQTVLDKLEELYGSPDNVDLWPAGMSEEAVPGGILGPTFTCLLARQFKRTREGDRFWYENPGVFTGDQLSQLKQASLSRVLCDNGDYITKIQRDAFAYTDYRLECREISSVNLLPWKECCDECEGSGEAGTETEDIGGRKRRSVNEIDELKREIRELRQAVSELKKN